jgi:hypothetical protein
MKKTLIILSFVISNFSFGQTSPIGKYINDDINENNYLIFYSDSSFKYRYLQSLMSDIACGIYSFQKDTILLFYLSDMRDTMCNEEMIDAKIHYDSTLERPNKLFYYNDKLYLIRDDEIVRKVVTKTKPPKSWGFHKKYFLFGPYINNDAYYMITESKVKWKKD